MSKSITSVEKLSKAYRIGSKEEAPDTMVGSVLSLLKSPLNGFQKLKSLGTLKENAEGKDILWALKDVSFEVNQGEVVGIIGNNGAGKSTLLKILSRITQPTSGRAVIRGRMTSLLEVGTGFHPELTGRENIYMNGTILGMRKKEIDRRFDEIVDFSGIEKFLDTPTKRYSSGMQVRLAFAVAAHLNPEILVIDEVLAVGDVEFQKKCLGKMQDVTKLGRTVLFVSHNLAIVQSFCSLGIFISNGTIAFQGAITDVLNKYRGAAMLRHNLGYSSTSPKGLNGEGSFLRSIKVSSVDGPNTVRMGGTLSIEIFYSLQEVPSRLGIGIAIEDSYGTRIFNSTPSREYPDLLLDAASAGWIKCELADLPLTPGDFVISLVVGNYGKEVARMDAVSKFEVTPFDVFGTGQIPIGRDGYFFIPSKWTYSSDPNDV